MEPGHTEELILPADLLAPTLSEPDSGSDGCSNLEALNGPVTPLNDEPKTTHGVMLDWARNLKTEIDALT
jgi:hypothetical protein